MFWIFQRIFSFFVKRNRTERRKNATSRSIFDKYLDYLANEDRKKILIKSALSLNKFNHPAYADAVKNVPAELLSKVVLREIYLNKGYGSVGIVYAIDTRLFLYQKSLGTNFGVYSIQRIEKTWKERRESLSGTSF